MFWKALAQALEASQKVKFRLKIDQLQNICNKRKYGMERKGLRVNMDKTKFLISGTGLDLLKDSGKYPCAVCRTGVGANSIQCSLCKMWVHKKCSGITGRLRADPNFVCKRCCGAASPIDGRPVTCVDVDGCSLDCVTTFCYLGDMLSAGGGCSHAIATRCCAAWKKFRKLLSILTSKHLSFKIHGKVYNICVRSVLLYGSETWAPNSSDLQCLRRNDRAMIRWICNVKANDEIQSTSLLEKLGINDITVALRSRRLRWFGHVTTGRNVNKHHRGPRCWRPRNVGRPKKSWSECIKNDINQCDLLDVDPLNRLAWRAGVNEAWCCPPWILGKWLHPKYQTGW